jgi:hypothetical protein
MNRMEWNKGTKNCIALRRPSWSYDNFLIVIVSTVLANKKCIAIFAM